MTGPLYELLPRGEAGSDELLGRFLDYVSHLGLTLYPAQEDAILALFEGHNVILNTPTGSGKSLVASALPWCITLDNSKGISRLRFWAKNRRVNGINDLPVFMHQGTQSIGTLIDSIRFALVLGHRQARETKHQEHR